VFHRFEQAKFRDGGLVLGSSQFTIMPSENNAWSKNGRKQLKNKQLAL
jgi:hypothetical protein